ncbi:MAG: hypothetical protein A3D31_15670 [Candidatus Fluviicola riflensis]|nr:MAG: hypothetical protein CHH17_00605 [Candidatus Fluviicola riflensis]OGS78398.1 MAG: hypothetical protein A3D31_15670 [Candidatus Fluviicola riflensis]OGS85464.1 MAG: hypothetical protein A2724_12605 [Fluviicola sp. RIFCSPHIGHO2_01_FULL_43_53]OGS87505.1 MAG: hypothetical protein A3E30_09025 [Fluviicola sp. RIFCSPHIGHO2_12_FULL_43_24]
MTFFIILNKKSLMGSSKTVQYSAKEKTFARTAKAMGHPARIVIVQFLAAYGLGTNKHFMEITKLCDATICQHLKELEHAGIITELYIKNKHYYRLCTKAEESVKELQLVFSQS